MILYKKGEFIIQGTPGNRQLSIMISDVCMGVDVNRGKVLEVGIRTANMFFSPETFTPKFHSIPKHRQLVNTHISGFAAVWEGATLFQYEKP